MRTPHPPRLHREFESFIRDAEETFRATGPIATHGRRLSVYKSGGRLFLKVPGLTVEPEFTLAGLRQFLRVLDCSHKTLDTLIGRLSADLAVEILNDLIQWRFVKNRAPEGAIKSTRPVSPFIAFPEKGTKGFLRGIWWSEWDRKYDLEMVNELMPFIPAYDVPLIVKTDEDCVFFVVDSDREMIHNGHRLQPGVALLNIESGAFQDTAKMTPIAWMADHDVALPAWNKKIPGERNSSWPELITCIDDIDVSVVSQEGHYRYVKAWRESKWRSTWTLLRSRYRSLFGPGLRQRALERHREKKAAASSSSRIVLPSTRWTSH